MGHPALDQLGEDGFFVPCVHWVGKPLGPTAPRTWPGRARRNQIYRPLSREPRDLVLWLRLWRQRAPRQEMLRAAYRQGDGARRGLARRTYADPEADLAAGRCPLCRRPPPVARAARPTWRCCADPPRLDRRDDRRRHRLDALRQRRPPYAVNPEAGFFGAAPGTGEYTNKNAVATLSAIASSPIRPDRRWRCVVGGPDRRPAGVPDRLAGPSTDARLGLSPPPTPMPASPSRPRKPRRSRAEWADPAGVPISAILFGGRRARAVPLVTEAFDWPHGVYLAPTWRLRGLGGGRQCRRTAPRPVRDAAVLRLQHG